MEASTQLKVPLEKPDGSLTVIYSSSNFYQGDNVAAPGSSSNVTNPSPVMIPLSLVPAPSIPSLYTPNGCDGDAPDHGSGPELSFNLTIDDPDSSIYASLFDIYRSANSKTYPRETADTNTTIAGNTKNCTITATEEEDWAPNSSNTAEKVLEGRTGLKPKNANLVAILSMSSSCLTTPQGGDQPNKVLDKESGSKLVVNTQNGHALKSWVNVIEGPATNRGWGIPRGMGLRGGGENSLNTGTAGWGTPPSGGGAGWGGNPPGPPQGQWGAANRPPGQPPTNTNQSGSDFNSQNKNVGNNPSQGGQGAGAGAGGASAAGGGNSGNAGAAGGGNQPPTTPGSAPTAGNTSWAQAAGKGLPQGNPTASTSSQNTASKQIEQLNSMREALFSQDGWGGQHVNQDTSWDTPGSPEPGGKDAGAAAPLWKQNVNNGTDLWEANLRNGGQPPAQPQNKTPWGQGPINPIGGTWGEDEEVSDAGNVWTGVPCNNSGGISNANPWPGNPAGPKPEWPAGPGAGPTGVTGAGGAAATNNWGDPRAPVPMDPRDSINRDVLTNLNDMNLMRMRPNDNSVLRGDPRGVSGRLNSNDQMWATHQPPPTGKIGPGLPPGNQWSGGLPKDMGGMNVSQGGKTSSGWEEPSPPAQRRNIPNYDDGTSLWGQQPPNRIQPAAPGMAPNNNLAHWKEANGLVRSNMACPPGMPSGTRMPGAAGNMKPGEAPVWGGPGHNGAWDQEGGVWGDENKMQSNWGPGEPPLTPPSWAGAKPGVKPGWAGEDSTDNTAWGHPSMQRPPVPRLTSDIIYNSKQFRALCDLNYKKEDVETALRTTNMNLQDAKDLLTNWSRREEQLLRSGFNQVPVGFSSVGPGNAGNNPASAASLLNNPSLSMNNMKLMAQTQPGGQGVAAQPRPGNQPSAQQLKLLVNQIQLAVQAGYLNQQILSQPLAPHTLLLLNQLLQQIKVLQQLNQRQQLLNVSGQLKANANLVAPLSVQINKTKQAILNYQNQIAAHQANYMKQQQQQHQPQLVQPGDANDIFKPGYDPLSNFPDLSINEKTAVQSSFQGQSQSRLNQWKLPSLDKDGEGSEFSRAPGSAKSHTSNINPLLGQSSETWSSVGRNSDSGWPDSSGNDLGGDKDSQWPTSQQQNNSFADIIPEFEPGKPWKGTQMKSVEEDPSMTPGSVARSPLSLATIKDDILSDNSKSSPGPTGASADSSVLTSLGLSSSPWTNLNSVSSSIYTSPLPKSNSKSWENPVTSQSSELWLAPGKTARGGPPPGLGGKQWGDGPGAGSRSSWVSSPSSWGSSWLILRNLTPQIDGSTLKTLCCQHGPLQNFHLYLNAGIAFAKYSSREEASKAQQALNNCVLSNTTIFAESPGESEVATLLNQLGHAQPQTSQQPSNWNIRGQTAKPLDTWATSAGSLPGYAGSGNLWQSNPSGSTLWGSEGDTHRTTPSGASLNSFLPPDLLNGETM